MLGEQRHQRLEDVDLVDVRLWRGQRQLGQDLAQGRAPFRVEFDARECLAEGGRKGHVRQMPLEQRTGSASDPDSLELSLQLVEQSRLAEPRFPFDLDQGEAIVDAALDCMQERVKLCAAPEEADGVAAGIRLGALDRAGQKRADVLLSDDGRLEGARFRGRLEAELVVESLAVGAIAAERLMRAAKGVEGEHL